MDNLSAEMPELTIWNAPIGNLSAESPNWQTRALERPNWQSERESAPIGNLSAGTPQLAI